MRVPGNVSSHASSSSSRRTQAPWFLAMLMAFVAAGCGDNKSSAPGSAEVASAVPEQIAELPLAEIAAPPEALAYGGVENLDKLLDPLSGLAGALGPGLAEVKQQVPSILQQALALKSTTGFDLAQPIRVAVLDPKKYSKGGLVLLFHLKDHDSLLGMMPDTKVANDAQNEFGWATPGGHAYLNMAGNVAVISADPGVWTAQSAFLKQLSASKVPAPEGGGEAGATVIVPVPNLLNAFATELDRALATAKAQAETPGIDPKQARALATSAGIDQGAFDMAKQLDAVTLKLRPTSEGYALSLLVKPRPSTDLDTFAKGAPSEAKSVVADRFPKESPAFVVAALGVRESPMFEKAMRLFASVSMSPEQTDRMMEAWSAYMKASTGDMVFGAVPKKDGSMGVVAMWGVKDADAAHAAQKKMLASYDEKEMKDSLAAQGLTLHIDPKAYSVEGIDVAVQKTEMKNAPAGMAALASFLEVHTAIGHDAAYVAYGPTAKESLQLMLDPKAENKLELGLSKSAAYERASKSGVAHPTFVAFVSPDALFGPGAGSPPTTGISVTGGVTGGSFELDIDAPSAAVGPALRALSAVAQQIQSQNAGPPPMAPAPPTGPGAPVPPGPGAPPLPNPSKHR